MSVCNRNPTCNLCLEFNKEYEKMLEQKKKREIDQFSIDYWVDAWHYKVWEPNH
ncbi:MAG: hypothetical protein V3U54_13385 [Thermodesulfobacteriota bacterium]